jgi:Putative binding domain, N-terminal/Viral BACON domain
MHKGPPHARPLTHVAAWLFACLAAGCGSTVATSTGPSPTKCAVTLAPPASPVSSNGATATVAVTTQPECAWSASSDAAWITGVAPSFGQGSGQLQMQVAANPDASARQGDIVVNSERARIHQDAAPCRFDLSATEQTIPAPGGSGGITVTTAGGCAWSAQADAPWVVLTSGTNGTGTGTVNFTIASNPGTTTRTASIVVANQTVKVTQQANVPPPPPTICSVSVTPKDISSPASGTGGSVSVSTASSCTWSASSNASWISLTGATIGTGDGIVTFGVAANSGAARSGSLKIGNQTVVVSQAGTPVPVPVPCSYSVSPLTTSVAGAGGAGTPIAVDTQPGCTWTAASNAGWLSITSGATGSGSGSVIFRASVNSGAARTGTLTVAGQTATVSQACSFTVTPSTVTVPAPGSTGTSVSLGTVATCVWTAVSNVSWISITSGPGGVDSGTVTFTVAANTGTARTGTLTIAGQTVTVNQLTGTCTYAILPMSQAFEQSGGTGGPVSVTTQPGCTWAAVSNANWLIVTSGSSGTGNGTVTYSVELNSSGSDRSGTFTIARQTFTVTQKK